jgi:hypothetical protein
LSERAVNFVDGLPNTHGERASADLMSVFPASGMMRADWLGDAAPASSVSKRGRRDPCRNAGILRSRAIASVGAAMRKDACRASRSSVCGSSQFAPRRSTAPNNTPAANSRLAAWMIALRTAKAAERRASKMSRCIAQHLRRRRNPPPDIVKPDDHGADCAPAPGSVGLSGRCPRMFAGVAKQGWRTRANCYPMDAAWVAQTSD